MADIGYGYGSECHLLRYLGRHRQKLNNEISKVMKATEVSWMDFQFKRTEHGWHDAELKSLDFMEKELQPVVKTLKAKWPHGGGVPNWDAVGKVKIADNWEWLLIEAKAHIGELRSNCGAEEGKKGKMMISKAINTVKENLNVPPTADWLSGYYQFCNRIVVLHHLLEHKVAARLLFIYFTGDKFPENNADCPQDSVAWEVALKKMTEHVNIPADAPICNNIHKIFLPVYG